MDAALKQAIKDALDRDDLEAIRNLIGGGGATTQSGGTGQPNDPPPPPKPK